MNEEELLLAYHVGDVLNIIQRTTHHLFDPDELLTVSKKINVFVSICHFHVYVRDCDSNFIIDLLKKFVDVTYL